MKRVFNSVLQVIGNTPMIKINNLVKPDYAEVWVKAEHLNPGGSVKDRMALFIVNEAERRGLLKPGGTIVENTSGNTGVGLAMIAALRGYKMIFTIPDKMSQEKINFLKAFGAKVVVTPTDVPADSPDSYYETAKRIAEETPNSFYVNQYNNPMNIKAHYETTGPEILEQMDGNLDYFIAGIGTGGTMSGAGKYLKEKLPSIKNIAVDPEGSVFYDYFKSGKLIEPHVYKVEGIGEDMIVNAMDFSVVDDIYQVTDQECFEMTRRLAREEGIFAGGSSGGAMQVALNLAEKVGKNKRIVALLPDSGDRYLSKVYSDEWMAQNNFITSDIVEVEN
ncbi:MAG: pyridoxal-phosphate dependent enzyme [candidate division Zixibacteria bacterium]|nr:pyridoxal-phosphate dependent enzyme [candidate division Zixibacteria bacterium]